MLDRCWNQFGIYRKQEVLIQAAQYAPFELFKSLFLGFTGNERLLYAAINGNQFLTFEFVSERTPLTIIASLDAEYRSRLIYKALKFNLPESKVRYYIDCFGQDLIKDSFLIPATASGLLDIIIEYNLCEASENLKSHAIVKAAEKNRKLTSAIIYVMDRYQPCMDAIELLQVISGLIYCSCREVLRYLIKKVFGEEISAELKGDILIFIASQFLDFYRRNKDFIVKFCMMMEWTKSQIKYTGEPSKFNEYLFGSKYMATKGWFEHQEQIEECFSSITDC